MGDGFLILYLFPTFIFRHFPFLSCFSEGSFFFKLYPEVIIARGKFLTYLYQSNPSAVRPSLFVELWMIRVPFLFQWLVQLENGSRLFPFGGQFIHTEFFFLEPLRGRFSCHRLLKIFLPPLYSFVGQHLFTNAHLNLPQSQLRHDRALTPTFISSHIADAMGNCFFISRSMQLPVLP